MTSTGWRRVGELFHVAVGMAPEEGRKWVAANCPDDPKIVAEVLSLLGSDEKARDGFVAKQIEPAVVSMLGTMPERVGPYRLVRELGRGGMGTVYLGERDDEEYQTQVAIKLVRRGFDTDLILHRFYRERQTLARLQHPHIARLLDGGTTGDGRPYIVMEFVKGSWITDYCREGGLGIARRLQLFLDVCGAVDYAHRQFVVHRDLKPGNILVDESEAVKLLDFGICKLLLGNAAEVDQTAEVGPAPFTPDYASPEQIRGEATNPASDVYALGAVLYELLTGTRPHRFKDLSIKGIEEGICETEVVRPSMAAGNKGWTRQLKGDLDNILLRALQKDPQRRYGSVEQLAEDVRRHLEHRPVKARPDTVRYRVGKFVRRRKGLVMAAAAVLVVLSGGVVVSMRSARIANENLRMVRQLSNTFVFDVHDAVRDLPGSTRARQLIVQTGLQYLDALSRNASGDGELQQELAAAYQRIGDVQGNVMGANLGNTAGALQSYQKALGLLDVVLKKDGANRPAMTERVKLHHKIGAVQAFTKDGAQALASYRRAAEMAEEVLARFPKDDAMVRQLAEIHMTSAYAVGLTGDYAEARKGYARALTLLHDLEKARPGDPALENSIAAAYSGEGQCDVRFGRLQEGLAAFREAAARLENLVRLDAANVNHQRELTIAYSNMGDVLGNPNLRNLGDPAGAAKAYGRMTEVSRQIHKADPADQRARSDYAIALTRTSVVLPVEQTRERIALLRQAVKLHEEVARVSPKNLRNRSELALTYNFLGDAYEAAGDWATAERTFLEGLRLGETLAGTESSTLVLGSVMMCRKVGALAVRRGDRAQALAYAERALRLADPDGPLGKHRPAAAQGTLTPRGYAAIGLVYAGLAQSGQRRPADAAEARRWLEKSMEHWRALEAKAPLSNMQGKEKRVVETALEGLR